MLQKIRDKFHGAFSILMIAGIGVALTIGLVDTDTITGNTQFAARVNDEEIPLAEFRQIAQQQVLEQEQNLRGEIPDDFRQQVEQNVLEGMVRNRVVAQYVRDQGYRVSDQRVAEHIRSLPGFQVGGQFSQDGYLAALASQGVAPAAFEEERRAALQVEDLQNGLLESAFFTPAEFRRFVVLEGERRRAAIALLDPQRLSDRITTSEEEIKAYYNGHPQQYESPESVTLEYVEVRTADLPPAAEPTDDELRAAYEASPERFQSPEQRRARHILVAVDQDTDDAKARKLAGELHARLKAGEDFAALARKYSDDPGSASSGGDLGWAGKGTYVEAFETALYAQQVGDISEPVKTEFGYHLIQLQELRAGAQRSFEEARQELADEARARGASDRYFTLTEKMDDAALENPSSLDSVAAATGLPVQRIEQFTRNGGGAFGANRAVIDAAFSAAVLEGGENSPLIEIAEGRAVVLRVRDHRPVKLRPLDEVRNEVEKSVRADKAARLAAEQGSQIVTLARGGADLAKLTGDSGWALQTSVLLARNSAEIPPDLLDVIFRAPRPRGDQPVIGGTALAGGGYAVYRLDEVIPAKPDDVPRELRDTRKNLLARQTGIAETTALALDLRKQADVVIAPSLFEQQESL